MMEAEVNIIWVIFSRRAHQYFTYTRAVSHKVAANWTKPFHVGQTWTETLADLITNLPKNPTFFLPA